MTTLSEEQIQGAFDKMQLEDRTLDRLAHIEKRLDLISDMIGLLARAESHRIDRIKKNVG